jgi:radical SAM superfamily enzyme YgiQ (UPF0313 family)
MKILLICPRAENDYHDSGAWAKVSTAILFVPSGLQLLAAITPPEHEVQIIDEHINQKVDFDGDYDLVGLTLMTPTATRAYKIAARFRERGIKVIFGGYHASLLFEEAKDYCDSVCIGEAENVWHQILKDVEAGTLKQSYKSEELADLSKLPWLRRDLSPRKKYRASNLFLATRGCPYRCNFCAAVKLFGNKYRHRPIEDIVQEIKELKANRALEGNMVYFADDNIIANPKWAKMLFEALIPLKIKWISACSLDITYNDELLNLAKQSGCADLAIGFESVSDASLKEMKKTIGNVEKYKIAIEKLHKHKIIVHGLFIFGFDTDGKDIFDKTIQFIDDNNIEYATFSILTPFPGTEIFDKYLAENRLLHKKWNMYDFAHTVYQPKQMTPQELQDGLIYTTRNVYKLSSIVKRLLRAKTKFFFPLLISLGLKTLYNFLPKKVEMNLSN